MWQIDLKVLQDDLCDLFGVTRSATQAREILNHPNLNRVHVAVGCNACGHVGLHHLQSIIQRHEKGHHIFTYDACQHADGHRFGVKFVY